MPRTATSSEYTYIDCPACRQGISVPLAVGAGPYFLAHDHGRTRCRIMVWVEATVDRSYRLPSSISAEEATTQARQAWKRGGWRTAGAA